MRADGGVPACFNSVEEQQYVQTLEGYVLDVNSGSWPAWFGLYRDPTGPPIDESNELDHWDLCVDGELGNGTFAWDRVSPHSMAAGSQYGEEYCGALGHWGVASQTCDNYGGWTKSCICGGPAKPSERFADDLVLLDASAERYLARTRVNIGIWLGILFLLSLLPTCCFCVCALRRRNARALDERQSAATDSVTRTKERLSEAGDAAARLRLRVSLVLLQVGAFLTILGMGPMTGFLVGAAGDVATGPPTLYLSAFPVGVLLSLMAIRPTDAISIRLVSGVTFGFTTFFCLGFLWGLSIFIASPDDQSGSAFLYQTIGFLVTFITSGGFCARAMICSCCCGGKAAQPPRVALRTLWIGMRILLAGLGLCSLSFPLLTIGPDGLFREDLLNEAPEMVGALAFPIVGFSVTAILTPRVRGMIHRWLGSLGKTGTKEAEAASIAALIGGGAASRALDEGARHFRALPLSALTAADLNSSTDSGLNAKTRAAKLGDVDGFVSHSWSDDGAAKYARLLEWAKTDGVRSDGETHPLIWLDKACIDQSAIELNLMCLPVSLSGCRSLVVLAGPTYTSRLWCVVELFVWLRVGGARERIKVAPLAHQAQLGGGGEAHTLFASFDAAKAKCFKAKDRQHLLGVIESGFGDLVPFNKVVRGLLATEPSSRAVRPEDLDNADLPAQSI